ncbi:MAG: hypothetical protein IT381_27265 [Deltaproteobacteria bacterium]|nr:hypothetical protein [Deltaproteobacteria bacterium]
MLSRVAAVAVVFAACQPTYARDREIRLNALVWKGSHNSYHVESENAPTELAYTHAPLATQLEDQGVRQFELDIYYEGDHFDVRHIRIFDERTTCKTLAVCLAAIGAWSKGHRMHAPIVIMIELKDFGDRVPLADYFALLDATVTDSLGADRLITQALVRGDAATLADALAARGWPTLEETRGKVLVFLLADPAFAAFYTSDPARPLFIAAAPGAPYAAIASVDSPRDEAKIAAALAANMIVRTRADDPAEPEDREARGAAALASSAQIISTDYPAPRDGYVLAWPKAAIVDCHKTLAPRDCRPRDIEAHEVP